MVNVLPGESAIEAAIPPGVALQQSSDHLLLQFDSPRRALSSAVLNGGIQQVGGVLNYRVAKTSEEAFDDPAYTLSQVCDRLHAPSSTVGMMTAASMASLRVIESEVEDERLTVLVTSGLDNARSPGDTAEFRSLARYPKIDSEDAHAKHHGQPGTINLIVLCSAQLADEVMVEMVMIATEAKAAMLQKLNVRSPISGEFATGTGTDAIVIVSGDNGPPIRYAGKHTLLGERLARSVAEALRSSIEYDAVNSL